MAVVRLAFDQTSPELQAALRPRVERLGYFGEYFAIAGHVPKAALASIALIEALKAPLSPAIVETIALSVAGRLGAAYERVQHERLAVKLGFSPQWVRDTLALDPGRARELSAEQGTVQRFVLAYVERFGANVGVELEALVEALGSERAIATMQLTGAYVNNAMFMNAFELLAPVPSIFEEIAR